MNKNRGSQRDKKGLSDRIRSSLVLKLNLRILGILLAGFIGINLLIAGLFLGITLWQGEVELQAIKDNFGLEQLREQDFWGSQNYEVQMIEEEQGLLFPAFFQERMPLEVSGVRRGIDTPSLLPRITWIERMARTEYFMVFSSEDLYYRVNFPLQQNLQVFSFFMLIILIAQALYIMSRIGKNTRVIRRTLKPLSEMAAVARNLQEDMGRMSSTSAGAELHNLAGALKTIDAGQLDKRIAVDSSQNELKDLAQAINDMLNRINQSYESQVRFVSDASHELRTPISVIQGYVGLLDRWGKHDEKTLQESIGAIKGEAENMKALVEQLLFLARGDNETIQLHREVFDCCGVVEEIIKETRLIDSSHDFITELKKPACIEGDRQLIKQAVRILMDNSIKYTPAEEKIIIRVFTAQDMVKIQVQDNGIGIAPEDVPNIFDRFYRSDESRARKTGGSGLGLAIARWIVERHAGFFEVISRLDIGTRTTINLPRAEAGNDPDAMKEAGSEKSGDDRE